MKLKRIIEIDEANYKKFLELAFIDYLEDGAQAVDDTKRFIKEVLKNI